MSSLNENAGTDFGRRDVRAAQLAASPAASLWGPPGPRVGQMPPARRPGLGPRGASRTAAECLLCPRQASPGAHLRPLLLPLRVPGPPCLTTSGGVAPAVCHASHGAKRTQQEAAPFLPPALPGWSDGRSVGYRPCPEGFNRGPEQSVPAIRGVWPRRASVVISAGGQVTWRGFQGYPTSLERNA